MNGPSSAASRTERASVEAAFFSVVAIPWSAFISFCCACSRRSRTCSANSEAWSTTTRRSTTYARRRGTTLDLRASARLGAKVAELKKRRCAAVSKPRTGTTGEAEATRQRDTHDSEPRQRDSEAEAPRQRDTGEANPKPTRQRGEQPRAPRERPLELHQRAPLRTWRPTHCREPHAQVQGPQRARRRAGLRP
jgi:hypothetical protein